MELWIPITVAAAFLQNVRSVLQKQLTGRLSVNGATYVRFCYGLPFAWLYLAMLSSSREIPEPSLQFLGYCLAGGIGQMLATACLVASFTYRNFAVGTAFSKTEVVQAAVFGLVVLGDMVSWRVGIGSRSQTHKSFRSPPSPDRRFRHRPLPSPFIPTVPLRIRIGTICDGWSRRNTDAYDAPRWDCRGLEPAIPALQRLVQRH